MKIEIQENEINLFRLGESTSEAETVKRTIFFEIQGKEYSCDVILDRNNTGENYDNPENFYMMNKEMVDAALVTFLSEHHFYNHRDEDGDRASNSI